MARLPRLTLPGYPHHVIQRGNNRQITFHHKGDFELLLDLLGEYSEREKVDIHAYVLMSNHFHLLVTPQDANGLSRMMQAVGRRYVQTFNHVHQRTGTLWEGRFRANPIQTERYLLACMAYLDLNPVRAGMVARAADYPWSSYGHYAGLRVDKLVKPHPLYWELGNTPFAREAAYAELINQGVTPQQQAALTESALKGWALGEADFVANLQKRTDRRVSRDAAGRPFNVPKPKSKLGIM
jgi:putative transposase